MKRPIPLVWVEAIRGGAYAQLAPQPCIKYPDGSLRDY